MRKEFEFEKVIIYGEELISVWLIIFLIKILNLKKEVIIFKYDLENLRPYEDMGSFFGHFISRWLERYCMLKSDKIIYRYSEEGFKLLPFYNKIRNKDCYMFRLIVTEQPKISQIRKLSDLDGELHLVNVGSVQLKDSSHAISLFKLFPKITKQKIHFHFYMKADEETIKRFKQISETDKYFHYEHYLADYNLLLEMITQYDYGIFLQSYDNSSKENHYLKSTFGNRVLDYLSSGIPIICIKEAENVSKFVESNKIGYSVSYKEIYNLRALLKKQDFTENINKVFCELNNYEPLIKYIEQ